MIAKSEKIKDNIYYVGVLDWNLEKTRGFKVNGTSYNAFLIFGEDKNVLIDNNPHGQYPNLIAKIKDAFKKENKEEKIDIIIEQRIVEKEHSGALPYLHKKYPNATIYCGKIAIDGLKNQYPTLQNADIHTIEPNETINIGGKTLEFLDTMLLQIFTYIKEDKILFSNNMFGQLLCYPQLYADEVPEEIVMDKAKQFYANIYTPLSTMVLDTFQKLNENNMLNDAEIIAPSHGQIWKNPEKIIDAYTNWATGKCEDKITVIYDTMYGSTKKMAYQIAEGIISEDTNVVVHSLASSDRGEIAKDILDSKAIALGMPTRNGAPFPSVGDLLYYMIGLAYNRTGLTKKAITFGSTGGHGGAIDYVEKQLETVGFEVEDKYQITFVPRDDVLEKCYNMGQKLAKSIKE